MRSHCTAALLRPIAALALLAGMLGTSLPAFAVEMNWDWEEDFTPTAILPGSGGVSGSNSSCANDGSDLEVWMTDLLEEGTVETGSDAVCTSELVWS